MTENVDPNVNRGRRIGLILWAIPLVLLVLVLLWAVLFGGLEAVTGPIVPPEPTSK